MSLSVRRIFPTQTTRNPTVSSGSTVERMRRHDEWEACVYMHIYPHKVIHHRYLFQYFSIWPLISQCKLSGFWISIYSSLMSSIHIAQENCDSKFRFALVSMSFYFYLFSLPRVLNLLGICSTSLLHSYTYQWIFRSIHLHSLWFTNTNCSPMFFSFLKCVSLCNTRKSTNTDSV